MSDWQEEACRSVPRQFMQRISTTGDAAASGAMAEHAKEVAQIIAILTQRARSPRKRNPILVGYSLTERLAIVSSVAHNLANPPGAESRPIREVWRLDVDALLAAEDAAAFYHHAEQFISVVRASSVHMIVFIDGLHRLVGGDMSENPKDAFNLLYPALARREIQILATAPLDAYQRFIEGIAALEAWMVPILAPDIV